jgi:hypothetical protein
MLQLSNAFKPEHDDIEYAQGKYMLQMLGLQVSASSMQRQAQKWQQWQQQQ